MPSLIARRKTVYVFAAFTLIFLYHVHRPASPYGLPHASSVIASRPVKPAFDWANVSHRYPVPSMAPMPSVKVHIPTIQHEFDEEAAEDRKIRLKRQQKVKEEFLHAWHGYKNYAWLHDEVTPISGYSKDPFGGWAATLVDSLDTLWIMNLTSEFEEAVHAINTIDFSTCSLEELNVFEATIRYLGGFLAAYDLSEGRYPTLLQKAIEMGHMLYKAFDTPNRMPVTRWDFRAAMDHLPQEADDTVLQRSTKLPGLFPTTVNARRLDFTVHSAFTIGGMAGSLYEHFPKQHLLLHGASPQYRKLFTHASIPIKRHMLYRPMTPGNKDVLLPGDVATDGASPPQTVFLEPKTQHLSCYAGGMFALAGRVFANAEDVDVGRRLTDGCLWAYDASPHGIMPEAMYALPCPQTGPWAGERCEWQEDVWFDAVETAHAYGNHEHPLSADALIAEHHLRKGVARIVDPTYLLRPDAIESLFVTYRVTGDWRLPDRAWRIFEKIVKHTRTRYGHAALEDCVAEWPRQGDRMESFWLAETLKYFYLVFAEPTVVSLDEWVFNTEAHPFRWAGGNATRGR
ncbi:putative endoplasmic reticulum mannosyl-oligosaccharide 1,2-alpha-mannosidase [Macrophomina phaseolina]|uniref:alpha-1,2-Mannosidase n=1 Tax=Macrophomina phaseolina TaxID=35725 RepID=A0ABQ8GLX4_9PEZI|nr:putative endoplasmic reticulum mannosyl-oligosaccharide 1,2-alpha-mannosidase [Macrophomina phaseolina]